MNPMPIKRITRWDADQYHDFPDELHAALIGWNSNIGGGCDTPAIWTLQPDEQAGTDDCTGNGWIEKYYVLKLNEVLRAAGVQDGEEVLIHFGY